MDAQRKMNALWSFETEHLFVSPYQKNYTKRNRNLNKRFQKNMANWGLHDASNIYLITKQDLKESSIFDKNDTKSLPLFPTDREHDREDNKQKTW